MKAKQLKMLLVKAILARMPILITGAPGVGKSDIVGQSVIEAATFTANKDVTARKTDIVTRAAVEHGIDLIISHPAVSDPTDYKGLPWPEKGAEYANFIPFGDFHKALSATRPTVWFFDDLGQASNAVQAACMQLFLARRVNGHILPDCVTFLAATNRRTDRAAVSGLLEPLKSRFATIVELEADIQSWCEWALTHDIPFTLLAFLQYRSELLCKFNPSADLTNSPLPRTWAHLAKLEALELPAEIEADAFTGAVGSGAATEYLAFRRMARELVNIDDILADPSNAKIPTKPDQLWATVVGLAGKANVKNFSRVLTYCERLVTANKGEFSALCVRDSARRTPEIKFSDAYRKMTIGPIGQLIRGEETN